jgi:hypothetical protein
MLPATPSKPSSRQLPVCSTLGTLGTLAQTDTYTGRNCSEGRSAPSAKSATIGHGEALRVLQCPLTPWFSGDCESTRLVSTALVRMNPRTGAFPRFGGRSVRPGDVFGNQKGS